MKKENTAPTATGFHDSGPTLGALGGGRACRYSRLDLSLGTPKTLLPHPSRRDPPPFARRVSTCGGLRGTGGRHNWRLGETGAPLYPPFARRVSSCGGLVAGGGRHNWRLGESEAR
jgi:hypothetical protein